jgi:glycosyltransferase involved in cell wall biosynthesis
MNIAYSVVKNIRRGGGIEKYTLELGRRMVLHGHRVTVFTMDHHGEVEKEVEGMRIVPVFSLSHSAMEKVSCGFSAAMRAVLARDRFDIVHNHSVGAGAFGFLPRLRGIRTILQMHGIEWKRTRWSKFGIGVLRILEAMSLRSHNAYTAVSKTQCEFYRNHTGVKMIYIPTGADIKPHTPVQELVRLGLRGNDYILFASRLVREKGAHHLIQAFRKLETDAKLVIAGDAKGEEDYKNELRRLAEGDHRILFPGYVEGRLLDELFSNALIYVQPSELEGLSIALLEAMSYGNCCLVSDIPENQEAIGKTGETFRNADPDDLQTRLARLLPAADRRQSLGQAARERVRREYSWDSVADRFEQLYTSLLNHGAN